SPQTPEAPDNREAPAGADRRGSRASEARPSTDSPTERQTDDLPCDLSAVMCDDHEERSLVAQEDRDDLPFENIVRSVSSLTDHLDEQLRFATEDDIVRRIGNEIIGNLDEDGYLRAEVPEIADRCKAA